MSPRFIDQSECRFYPVVHFKSGAFGEENKPKLNHPPVFREAGSFSGVTEVQPAHKLGAVRGHDVRVHCEGPHRAPPTRRRITPIAPQPLSAVPFARHVARTSSRRPLRLCPLQRLSTPSPTRGHCSGLFCISPPPKSLTDGVHADRGAPTAPGSAPGAECRSPVAFAVGTLSAGARVRRIATRPCPCAADGTGNAHIPAPQAWAPAPAAAVTPEPPERRRSYGDRSAGQKGQVRKCWSGSRLPPREREPWCFLSVTASSASLRGQSSQDRHHR